MTEHGRKRLWTWVALSALMLIGVGLRFYRIDRPALWGDEVATYQRVLGSFDELMERLKGEGFVPLHYVSIWWLGKWTLLTPLMMRLLPAIAGVLFIPAVYLLARQMFDRRVGLAAAVMATVGAFGLIYSRDAKMYMQTWLFVTLFVGLMLLWWRMGVWKGLWVWPLWVVCGAAAVMFHATAMIVVGLTPLMLLVAPARRRAWWGWAIMGVMGVIGLAGVMSGPAIYYLRYNQYIEKTAIVPVGTEEDKKGNWGHSGLDWVDEFNQGTSGWGLTANSAANYLLGVQWPREKIDPRGSNGPIPQWFVRACVWGMTGLVGLMVLGVWWGRGAKGDRARRDTGQAEDNGAGLGGGTGVTSNPSQITDSGVWWRSAGILAMWLVLPTYGVYYCRSFVGPASPWEMAGVIWGWMGWGWLPVWMGAFWLAIFAVRWRRGLGWGVRGVFAGMVAGTLGWAMISGGTQWGEKWVGLMSEQRWLAGLLICCGLTSWWLGLGGNAKERNKRLAVGGAIVMGIIALCCAAWWVWDVMAEKYVQSHGGQQWRSIWMPRYLGVVYPAVLVTCAAMFMRLPTVVLRWGAVAVFVGLNLTQGLARVEVDTEPPFAMAAKDAWLSRQDGKVGLVLDAFERDVPGAFLSRERMSYYLDMAAGEMSAKVAFDRGARLNSIERLRNPSAGRLRRYVAQKPELTKLIVWERFDVSLPMEKVMEEGVYKTLEAGGWKKTEQEIIATRQFWTWRPGNWYRRMVYEKQPMAGGEAAKTGAAGS